MERKSKTWAYLGTGIIIIVMFSIEQMMLLRQWQDSLVAQQQRSAIREEVLLLRRWTSDIDNGFRGYVLMRQPYFLAPMVLAEEEIPMALERLTRLTGETPALQGSVLVLKRRLDELITTKRRLATKMANGESNEVLAYIRAGEGLALAKTISAVFDDFESKIARQFPEADLASLERQKKTLWQLVAAQAGAVFVGVLVMELLLAAFAAPQRSET